MARSAVSFDFKGGREIEAALAELGNKATIRNTATRALKLAAQPIQQDWEAHVDVETGHLKGSIKIGKAISAFQKRGNSGDRVTTYVGVDESKDARLHIYAKIEEFGDDKEPANPAGRNAFAKKKLEAVDRLADDLRSEITKTAERAARKTARLTAKG